ncbi:MAG: ABC transporter permease [Desulfobacterales bacterium]|jgi:lipopolysaccharide transport system permease protein|nr:ABC transporter permease [Desulfobacterales bacterium]
MVHFEVEFTTRTRNMIPDGKTTVYRPNQRHEHGFIKTWFVMSMNILNSRELIWQLFRRDFLASYKKSFIGVAWIFISPIMGIVSWVFLNMTGMLRPGDMNIPYPVYVLIGTSMWGLFMGFFDSAEATLSSGKDLVLQVYYPREALLFKQTAQHLANFSISLIMILTFLLLFHVTPSWKIVFFPLVALPLFFLGASIGLVTSMISIVAVDIGRIIKMAMALLMYLTPIIYSDNVTNHLVREIIKWNPLTYLVCSCRDIIIFGRLYNTLGYLICSGASLLLFLVSWRLFYVSEDRIIERMI